MANQTSIKIDPLNSENYDTWKIHAEALLIKNNTWDYVNGTIKKPTKAENVKDWENEDRKARSDLILMISSSCLMDIKNCTTSYEVWEKLKSVHQSKGPAKKANLLKQLILNKISDSDDVKVYLSKFFDIVDKLQSMDITINEELLSIIMLYGLPDCYENFRAAIESRDDLPKPEMLKIKILEEYESRQNRIKNENGALYVKNHNNNKTNRNFERKKNEGKKYYNNNLMCFRCRKLGHPAFKCKTNLNFEKKEKQSQSNNLPRPAAFSVYESLHTTLKSTNMWCLDSGATSHMCYDIDKFHYLDDTKISTLNLANNDNTQVRGVGIVNISPTNGDIAKLGNTLYAPDLRTNLLSVSKITEKGYEVIFKRNIAMIMERNGHIVAEAKKLNNLYYIEERQNDVKLAAEDESEIMNLHKKFGHLNLESLKYIIKNKSILGVNCKNLNENKLNECDICLKGKMTRKPFVKGDSSVRTSYPLELIYSDICGPMRSKSNGGSVYFATFIDDYTRWSEVYFLKHKNEIFEAFKAYKSKSENFIGRTIKAIRTDNGKEYCNHTFDKYLQENGIAHQKTVEYTPQMNGTAERKNRTLVEMARCMLLQSKLKLSFWAEAIACANYIRNRCPSKSIDNEIPYTLWTGKRPSVNHFRIFGCVAYSLLNKPGRNKFDAKSRPMIFIGYDEDQKVYRLWDQEKREVTRSRDVVFLEKENHELMEKSEDIIKNENELEIVLNFTFEEDEQTKHSVDENLKSSGANKTEIPVDENININKDMETEFESKRGPGRPKFLKTGGKGRPKKVYSTLAAKSSSESNEESGDDIFIDASCLATLNNDLDDLNMKFWKGAILDELNAQKKNGTWEIVGRPKDKKVIKCRWVFQTKQNCNGNINRRKARLVAKGCSQTFGVDYYETFAPVARHCSIRLLLALAAQWNLTLHQLDFVTAYLNGDLEEEIYMELPEYYYEIQNLEPENDKVCLLKKAIYGLRQSGRTWYLKLNNKLIQMGFRPLEADPCIYIKIDEFITIAVIYVDDIIIASNNSNSIENFKREMSATFEMKDLGKLRYFLGIEFDQREDGKICMSQRKYIEDLLKKFNMNEANAVKTPMDVSVKLNKQMCPADEDEKIQALKLPFQSLIGSLIYLATISRPDISYCVSKLSQYNNCYGQQHYNAAKRVLRYLKGTKDVELVFEKGHGNIAGYTDADWASCEDDRRSYTGYIFKLGNTAISWESRKQRTVALSTTEAEYMAISDAAKEALYLRELLSEIGYKNNETITIFNDNKGAQFLAKNPVRNSRSKHIDIRHHFIREVIQNGEVSVQYIDTNDMIADLLTKPLPINKHWKCLSQMGLTKCN